MADVKISNLPASTTPLAGTEVLPIVQSGVTKQVSVANLTAGRDVGANSFSSAAGTVSAPALTTTGDTNTGIWFPAADTFAISTAGAERMRIDSAGRIGIAGTTVAGVPINIGYNLTGTTSVVNVRAIPTILSDVTSQVDIFKTQPFVQNAAFTLAGLTHYYAAQGSFGALSTVANQYGFFADAGLTAATNNYGFLGNIASGTGRFNFYASGTAANVFVGTTSIGGVVGAESLRVTRVASAVNYLEATGATTGNVTTLSAAGSDTNIGLTLQAKGTGGIRINCPASVFVFASVSGTDFTNYYTQTGSLTYSAAGASTNISYNFEAKGTGNINLRTGSALQFRVASTASAVNYLNVTGAVTTDAPVLSAVGSDTNIDLALTPKGTGVLKFGTYTAGILAQAGYITIKDAAGNTRNLLVG